MNGGQGMGKNGEGIKYKLTDTVQSWGCKVQHREYRQQYSTNCAWCQKLITFIGLITYQVK